MKTMKWTTIQAVVEEILEHRHLAPIKKGHSMIIKNQRSSRKIMSLSEMEISIFDIKMTLPNIRDLGSI